MAKEKKDNTQPALFYNQLYPAIDVDNKIYALKRSRTKDHELGRPAIVLAQWLNNQILVLPGTTKQPEIIDIMININNIVTYFNFKSITKVEKTAILHEWRNCENNNSFNLTKQQVKKIQNNIGKFVSTMIETESNNDLLSLTNFEWLNKLKESSKKSIGSTKQLACQLDKNQMHDYEALEYEEISTNENSFSQQ